MGKLNNLQKEEREKNEKKRDTHQHILFIMLKE